MERNWWSLGALVGFLLVAFLLLDGPVAVSSTVAGTFCTEPGDYDLEDVRIRYDRSTMIGHEGVEIRGTKVYYLDEITDRGSPWTFKIGTISRATLDRFVSLIARSGLFCLEDQYTDRFIIPASEPVYEDLTVSIGGDSKTVSITSGSGRGGPSRVRRVIDEIRTVGQSLPSVGGVEFCDRAPTDAVDAISTYCRHELSTLDREPPGEIRPDRRRT